METNWIDDVLRLNSRILATEALISAQAARIVGLSQAVP